MSLKRATPEDPRGLIAESYHIDDLDDRTARSLFLDWAMMDGGENPMGRIQILYDRYAGEFPEHPMTLVLQEGLSRPKKSGRQGRKPRNL